ncbi:MAG: type I methionyl aminopeptidase [Clostridiales bacterium]|nr:type I methionyl aminopeptidase [Clostridiales bacterium]
MITIKTPNEIELMRKANQIVRDTLDMLQDVIKEGMTTAQLDKLAHDFIIKCDAKPSFLGYGGFPASICTSVNEQVVHGIPSAKTVIKEGDIVSVDCGSIYKGYNGDAARTFEIGKVSEEKHKLVEVTKQSFFEGVKILKEGVRLGDLGYAIQSYAESFGYGVVRDLVGHGIGKEMHEDPQVPNYGRQGHGMRLKKNMTIAIEPMINMGTHKVYVLDDDWTIVTADNLPSAHYENTVLITEEGVEILSL